MSTPDPAGTDPDETGGRPADGDAPDASPVATDGAADPAAPGASTADDAPSPDADASRETGDGDASAEAEAEPAPSGGSFVDFLPSPVFVAIVAVTGIAGWFSWDRTEVQLGWTDGTSIYAPFVFIAGAWLVSVALHEFAHALVAYLSGDRGLRGSGHLRLNPFAYKERRVAQDGDRGGGVFTGALLPLLFLVIGGLGLTGPASFVDRDALRGRGSRMLVPLAGIVASLVLAALFAAAVVLLLPAGAVTDNWFIGGLMFLCYLNLTAALVNVLPVPGMDGYGFLVPLLEAATASPRRFERLEKAARAFGLFGVIAVFAVLWLPQANLVYLNAVTGFFQSIGMPQMDVLYGDLLMRFWAS